MASLTSNSLPWRTFDPVTKTVTLHYVEGAPVYSSDPTVYQVNVLDTETTGLSESSEVIELYIGRYGFDAQGRCTGLLRSYFGLREPRVPIELSAQVIHGIHHDELIGRQLDLQAIADITGGVVTLAFGARHDYNVLARSGVAVHAWRWGDVLDDISWRELGFPGTSLAVLCACHGFVYAAHRSEPDVHATARLISLSGTLPQLLGAVDTSTYILQLCSTPYESKDALRTQLGARWSAEQRLWYVPCTSVQHLNDTYLRFKALSIAGSTRVLTLTGSQRFDLRAISAQGLPWPA